MTERVFSIMELTCDYAHEPLAVEGAPFLRWKLLGEIDQRALRVRVASSAEGLEAPDLWDSGWIQSAAPYLEYAGAPIGSGQRAFWRLDAEGEGGEMAHATSTWKQGILPEDWAGEWIGFDRGRDAYDPSTPYWCADDFEDGTNEPFLPPPTILRGTFRLNRFDLREATLYVSALGLAEVSLNGRRAAADAMVPGACDYAKRVYYLAYDVKALLLQGENALGCVLADGLYAGYIGLNPRQWWGAKPRLNLQLLIEFSDGSKMVVGTDAGWKASFGPHLYADIMHGSGYDATGEIPGFDLPGFDDATWASVDTGAEYPHIPSAHPGVPVVEHERFPATITRRADGAWMIDCGKCFSGVLRVRVRGEAGARLDIYHAEEMDGEELYLRANRSAQAHDCYILKGEGEEVFQPAFTYHGFRYARIDVRGEAELILVEGVAISSELPDKALFRSGNEVVDTAFRLIENTRQSNMFDFPTDVCARDERLGWGAEGHFFMHTASRTLNNARFLRKWMQDIADGQLESGAFWATAPAVMMRDIVPFAGDLQSDMGLHTCWLLLTVYEDMPTVRKFFPALERYFAFQLQNSDRLVRFAIARDWLDIAAANGRSDFDHGYGCCDPGLLGTAYFARSAQMMAEIARALGEEERAEYYAQKYQEIRDRFHVFFGRRDRHLRGATQGAYLAAAAFGLLDADEMENARSWVLEDMARRGGITWGTATTPVALYGMRKLGLGREACRFLAQSEFPGIGYMAACGATAVWERWDAILDGKFHPHAMNAFDHIGLATVGDFMMGGLAGIMSAEPGFRVISFAPEIDEEIGSVEAEYASVRGKIASRWQVDAEALTYECRVPANARGRVELPCREMEKVQFLSGEERAHNLRVEDGKLLFDALPGSLSLRIFR